MRKEGQGWQRRFRLATSTCRPGPPPQARKSPCLFGRSGLRRFRPATSTCHPAHHPRPGKAPASLGGVDSDGHVHASLWLFHGRDRVLPEGRGSASQPGELRQAVHPISVALSERESSAAPKGV